jgi:hypothetical protein
MRAGLRTAGSKQLYTSVARRQGLVGTGRVNTMAAAVTELSTSKVGPQRQYPTDRCTCGHRCTDQSAMAHMLALQTALACFTAIAILAVFPLYTSAAAPEQQHATLSAVQQCTATELGSGSCSALNSVHVRGSKCIPMHSFKPACTCWFGSACWIASLH